MSSFTDANIHPLTLLLLSYCGKQNPAEVQQFLERVSAEAAELLRVGVAET